MATYTYSDFDGRLERQSDGDITLDTDLEAIKNSIQNILSTRKGSRRMLPAFGSALEEMLFEPMDRLTARRIGNELLQAIEDWDSRVEILGVTVNANYDLQQYDANVEYTVKGFGNIGNDTLRLILKRL
jgi:phage baseplate assembly protein W